MRGRNNKPPISLHNFLVEQEDHVTNLDSACHAVTTLFRDTLAQYPQKNCWYSEVDQPHAELALTSCLELADTPGCTAIEGRLAYLKANSTYPLVRVVERQSQGDKFTLQPQAVQIIQITTNDGADAALAARLTDALRSVPPLYPKSASLLFQVQFSTR